MNSSAIRLDLRETGMYPENQQLFLRAPGQTGLLRDLVFLADYKVFPNCAIKNGLVLTFEELAKEFNQGRILRKAIISGEIRLMRIPSSDAALVLMISTLEIES